VHTSRPAHRRPGRGSAHRRAWLLFLIAARSAFVGEATIAWSLAAGIAVLAAGAPPLRTALGRLGRATILGPAAATAGFAGAMAAGAVLRSTHELGDPLGPITMGAAALGFLAAGAIALRGPSLLHAAEGFACSIETRLDRLPIPFVVLTASRSPSWC
jgi:hypothetical protein